MKRLLSRIGKACRELKQVCDKAEASGKVLDENLNKTKQVLRFVDTASELRYQLFAMRYQRPDKPEEYGSNCVLLDCHSAGSWWGDQFGGLCAGVLCA